MKHPVCLALQPLYSVRSIALCAGGAGPTGVLWTRISEEGAGKPQADVSTFFDWTTENIMFNTDNIVLYS